MAVFGIVHLLIKHTEFETNHFTTHITTWCVQT